MYMYISGSPINLHRYYLMKKTELCALNMDTYICIMASKLAAASAAAAKWRSMRTT